MPDEKGGREIRTNPELEISLDKEAQRITVYGRSLTAMPDEKARKRNQNKSRTRNLIGQLKLTTWRVLSRCRKLILPVSLYTGNWQISLCLHSPLSTIYGFLVDINGLHLQELRKKEVAAGIIQAQTATKTPAVDQAAPEGKKTLRKGELYHHLDLVSLESVRQFADNFRRSGRPLDVLVCNAAVFLPTAKEPTYTAEGFELSVGTNHLGHFLLARLLLDDLKQSDYPSKRLIIVGSITGTNLALIMH
ncbi:hypothetical protein CRYUN_Cryun18bG0057700 [Craigia yunnanensis]